MFHDDEGRGAGPRPFLGSRDATTTELNTCARPVLCFSRPRDSDMFYRSIPYPPSHDATPSIWAGRPRFTLSATQ